MWTRYEGVSLGMCLGMFEGAAALQMPPYHWHRVAPFRQLVAPFEVVNDLRAVRTAHLHEEVEAVINDIGHELFHLVVGEAACRVHVLQFLGIPKTVMRHLLG